MSMNVAAGLQDCCACCWALLLDADGQPLIRRSTGEAHLLCPSCEQEAADMAEESWQEAADIAEESWWGDEDEPGSQDD